ncbi:MAG TPA: hypothetical protein VND19_09705 [Acetobacteraceae bacterium]|nr:hypothetical protein [Acetobacteraceae bacterium]
MPGHGRLFVFGVVCVAAALAGSRGACAQVVSANANVQGNVTVTIPAKAAAPAATGSTVAGAYIGDAVAPTPTEIYQVNGAQVNVAAPNAVQTAETGALQALTSAARSVAKAGNILNRKPYIEGAPKAAIPIPGLKPQLSNCTAPDAGANASSPCKVVADTGSFPLVAKAAGAPLSSTASTQQTTGPAIPPVNLELASGSATQTINAAGKLILNSNAVTQVDASKAVPKPLAVGFGVNRDPVAISGLSSTGRGITTDLSSVTFTLSSTGPATASGVFDTTLASIDGSSDVTQPESLATPFFDLLISAESDSGGAPVVNPYASSLTASGSISDNLGDVGLAAVTAGLFGDLTSVGSNELGFAAPYVITVGLPGTSPNALLYVDSETYAGAAALPAPGGLGTMLVGLLALAAVAARRGSVC